MRKHDAGWSETPAWYSVQWFPNLLTEGGRWDVMMNNAMHHASFPTMEAAQHEAARMNYQRGAYNRPLMFGMDGVE